MKKLLIVFLLVSGVVNGQRVTWLDSAASIFRDFSSASTIGSGSFISEKTTYDTIPIIYLWCDTSWLGDDEYKELKIRDPLVKWDWGYKTVCRTGFGWIKYQFLDRNKKPIPKSVVVWMVRKIN